MADVMKFCGVTDPHAHHRYVGGSGPGRFDAYFCCLGSTGPVDYEARYLALRAAIETLADEQADLYRKHEAMTHATLGADHRPCESMARVALAERFRGLLAETGDERD